MLAGIPKVLQAQRRRLYAALLSIVLLFAIASRGCTADRMILGENHRSIDPAGAQRKIIRVDGKAVECWSARSPAARLREPAAFVLFFPGTGARAEQWTAAVADGWGERAVEVWGVNYPGYGGSEGPAHLTRVGPAAIGAFDALRQHAGERPVFIQAASFGTTAALHIAAARRVDGMILWNPPPLRQLIRGQYGWWNLWLLAAPIACNVPADLDSIANARRATAPAVFLRFGRDEIVPARYQGMVIDAYPGPKRVIDMPGAKHSDPLTREAADQLQEAIDWMWHAAEK